MLLGLQHKISFNSIGLPEAILSKLGGFFMLLMEAVNLEKYYGDRKIIDIPNLKIYNDDKIGLVGINGTGKTTLINVLAGICKPDKGYVKGYGKITLINQLGSSEARTLNKHIARKFNSPHIWNDSMSGGEKTKFKMAEGLSGISGSSDLLFADEPTSNLDLEGIQLLEKCLLSYKGGIVLVSHDRELLDKVCNKIYELSDGGFKIYNGNFSDYKLQKTAQQQRQIFEYNSYINEKQRFESAMHQLQQNVKSLNKTPKRMGNSEARLHRLGNQRAEANLDNSAKRIKSRLDHLDIKEKPRSTVKIKFDADAITNDMLHKKILISGRGISKAFKNKTIFSNTDFDIYNGTKTALLGPNGSGKTTLLRMILSADEGIDSSEKLKIGYFSQTLDILDDSKSILDNIMEHSIYDETFGRTLLSRLLFKREDVYKSISVLSGGERVKAAFAKILLMDNNMLILDEPTNYLDINSIEAMEEALVEYDRTMLFVSHDRHFISTVANRIINIENYSLVNFNGSYSEFLSLEFKNNSNTVNNRITILQNRQAELISRLSIAANKDNKALLEEEYNELINELKSLKAQN